MVCEYRIYWSCCQREIRVGLKGHQGLMWRTNSSFLMVSDDRGKWLIWSTSSVLTVMSVSSASVVVIVSLGSSLTSSTPAVGPFELKFILLARFGDRTPEDRYISLIFSFIKLHKFYILICSMNWCTSDSILVALPHHVHIQTWLQFSHDGIREVRGEVLSLWSSAVVTQFSSITHSIMLRKRLLIRLRKKKWFKNYERWINSETNPVQSLRNVVAASSVFGMPPFCR